MAHATNTTGGFGVDPKNFKDFMNMPSFDKEKLIKTHRKNIEALTEANKMAVEVMQSLTQLQSQYMKKTFEDMTSMMQGMMSNSNQAIPLEKHAAVVKNHIDRTMEHGKAITSTLAQTHHNIYELFQNCMTSGMKDNEESSEDKKKKH